MKYKNFFSKQRAFLIGLTAFLLTGCNDKNDLAPVEDAWQQPSAQLAPYHIKAGDTLYSVAWTFGLDFRTLAAWNHLNPPYSLASGQVLRMGPPPTSIVKTVIAQKRTIAVEDISNKPNFDEKQQQAETPQTVAPELSWSSWQNFWRSHLAEKQHRPSLQWSWPVHGKVIENYSDAVNGDKGIDIAGRFDQPIQAAASGMVVYSGSGIRGYGNLIIIKHSDTYLSAYAHNQKILVQTGGHVEQGQVIALMGKDDAGRVKLHFEIRKNGRPIDPLPILRG